MLLERPYHALVSGRWHGPVAAVLRGLLGGLEIPYASFMQRRNARFDGNPSVACRVAAPVISVGNLTVGGTGKTPFVAWLAKWLLDRQTPVTIISRGYGARRGQPNDEALELAAQLPDVAHVQNRDRVVAARLALAANPRQVLVLDDAFQHRWLARDLDIVLLDALAPFGHEHLLPRGLLREPVASLARAQVVALSRSTAIGAAERGAIKQRVRAIAPQALWLELKHRPVGLIAASGERLPLEAMRGRPVAAFCGIGSPRGFRHTLSECGLSVVSWQEFADHCPYGPRDLNRLKRWLAAQSQVEIAICTRKDLVKISDGQIASKRLWALEIELEIVAGQTELETLLAQSIGQRGGQFSRGVAGAAETTRKPLLKSPSHPHALRESA